MIGKVRKSVSLMACFAIAMHAILAVVPAQAAPADPFSIICHSGSSVASDQTPDSQQQAPSKACDHCSLCAVASAAAAPDAILTGQLAPPSLLHVLTPGSQVVLLRPASAQHPARGPPRLT